MDDLNKVAKKKNFDSCQIKLKMKTLFKNVHGKEKISRSYFVLINTLVCESIQKNKIIIINLYENNSQFLKILWIVVVHVDQHISFE